MKSRLPFRALSFFLAVLTTAFLLLGVKPSSVRASGSSPWLACGTDDGVFGGHTSQVAVVQTSGPTIVGEVKLFDLQVPLNGVTPAFGFVAAGQPEDTADFPGNTLRIFGDDAPPHVLRTIPPGGNSFSSSCCNEQMVQAPDGSFYHAHYSDVIQQLSIQDGQSVVRKTFSQNDVVGMASDGTSIWISKWSGAQVGIWDPATNVFTPVFNTPSSAGGLAWDTQDGVLWVGMLGGSVIPYDASGNQLGDGFQPFGEISNTVDGLAFVPHH